MTRKKEYIFNPDFIPGIVYVWGIEGSNTEHSCIYKIGRTEASSSEKRRDDCQTGCPWRIFIVSEYYCEDSTGLEAHLHDFFSDCRMEGEWFRIRHWDNHASRTGAHRIRKEIFKYIQLTDESLWR